MCARLFTCPFWFRRSTHPIVSPTCTSSADQDLGKASKSYAYSRKAPSVFPICVRFASLFLGALSWMRPVTTFGHADLWSSPLVVSRCALFWGVGTLVSDDTSVLASRCGDLYYSLDGEDEQHARRNKRDVKLRGL